MSKLRVDKIAAPIIKDEFTGSVYFDGSGDYLSIPDSTDFSMGTGDYTIEGWFYFNATGTNRLFGQRNSSAGESQLLGEFYDGHTISYYHSIGGTNYTVTKTNIISLQTWYHIAITRHNQVLHLYVNGVLQSTNTTTGSLDDRAQPFVIGRQGNFTSNTFNGYISNFRVCKGHAVYTENFTPPTRELPVHTEPPKGVVFPAADNRTVLLACQSSTDATADSSGRHTITANGDVHAQSANPGLFRRTLNLTTVTENTGSVFFDGTGDYLSVPSSSDFNYEAGDFTVEGWIYMNSLPSSGSRYTLASKWTGGGDYSWICNIFNDSGNMELNFGYTTDGTSAIDLFSNGGPSEAGKWYHIAFARDGNTLRQFVNGVQLSTNAISGTIHVDTQNVNIGRHGEDTNYMNGYISNVRICKGHAVYKSQFIPPTRELEVHQGPDDDRTVLLACYDGENIFADKTGRHAIAAYGDRLSSPTPTATDSPIGSTTVTPGLTREVDPTDGPTFQGGAGFTSQNWLTLPKGTTAERNQNGGRGLIMGGYDGNAINSIEFITISSLGNAQDFGDLTSARFGGGGCGSSTRGLYGGGEPSRTPIDLVTIASTGNSVNFGSLDTAAGYVKACSNQTRGIWGGGRSSTGPVVSTNVIQYVTIATLGNSQDFGILTSKRTGLAAFSSPTRGIFSGGYTSPSPTTIATLDYITIAATGNALDFGDLLTNVKYNDAVSSGTRGIIGGGASPNTNVMQYVTISTLGDAVNFGDLITAREHLSSTDNSIRGVFIGGVTPTILNIIDYVTIASTGDASDFGDLSQTIGYSGSTSDSHGGLG